MRDWNHDGKIDRKDQMMDYCIFEELSKDDAGSDFHIGGGIGFFGGVLIAIAVLVFLAVVLGVGIPGAVWGFFLKVIAVVGFFSLLFK